MPATRRDRISRRGRCRGRARRRRREPAAAGVRPDAGTRTAIVARRAPPTRRSAQRQGARSSLREVIGTVILRFESNACENSFFLDLKCWLAASEWVRAEIQRGLRQRGGRDRRCGPDIFPSTLIWLFQRKHVADFSRQKNARQKDKEPSDQVFLFLSRKKHPRSRSGKREKYSWMKFSAELTVG